MDSRMGVNLCINIGDMLALQIYAFTKWNNIQTMKLCKSYATTKNNIQTYRIQMVYKNSNHYKSTEFSILKKQISKQ